MPAFVPARTRLARATESLAQVEEALAVAISLGIQTTEAGRFEELDAALRSLPLQLDPQLRLSGLPPLS
jgi:hypothetical protein